MSYCRFSCDDYQCDVYCYDSAGGITIHVARNRVRFAAALPPPVPLDQAHLDEWLARHRTVLAMVEAAPREAIALPYAGESFEEPDAAAALERLLDLRALGYRVPEFALAALREETEHERDR